MPPKRSAVGRNGTPARAFAPAASSNRRSTRTTPAPGPSDPPVENPQLPDIQTEQSFSYGSNKTPLLPRQLKARARMTTAQLTETIDEARVQENANIRAYVDEAHRQVDQGSSERDLRAARRSLSRETSQSRDASLDGSQIGPSTPAPPGLGRGTSLATNRTLSPVDEDDIGSGSSGSSPSHSSRPNSDISDQASIQLETEVREQAGVNAQHPRNSTPQSPLTTPYHRFVDWLDISFNRERAIYRNIEDASVDDEETDRKSFASTFLTIVNKPFEYMVHLVKAFYQITWCFLCLIAWVPAMIVSPYWRQRVSDTMRMLAITLGMENPVIKTTMRAVPILMLGLLGSTAFLWFYTDKLPQMGYTIGHTAHNVKSCLRGISHGFNSASTDFDASALVMIDSRLDKLASDVSSMSHILDKHDSDYTSLSSKLDEHQSDLQILHTTVNTLSAKKPTSNEQQSVYSKINYAAESMGAIIDPYLTSPTYHRPSPGLLTRLLAPNLVSSYRSSPPIEALRPWREFGDCWCSAPAPSAAGSPVHLAVLLGQSIIPTEAIIEQLPVPENPNPGRAPRLIEVWADFGHLSAEDFAEATEESVALARREKRGRRHGLPDRFLLLGVMELKGKGRGRGQTAGLRKLGVSSKAKVKAGGMVGVGLGFDTSKVVFSIVDNWGGDVTCLYRVRVHGEIRGGGGGEVE